MIVWLEGAAILASSASRTPGDGASPLALAAISTLASYRYSHLGARAGRQRGQAGRQLAALVRVERADRVGQGQRLKVVRDHTACSSRFRMADHAGADPRLDRPQWQCEAFGELAVRIALEKGRFDELSLIRGKAGQRVGQRSSLLPHQYGRLRRLDARARRGDLDRRHVDRGRVHGSANPPGAQAIDCAVARHAHDPLHRAARLRVVGLGSRPHADERLLQEVLRFPAIADDAQDEPEEQPAVPIVQLRECSGIARGDALQEAEVSGIADVHHLGAATILSHKSRRAARPWA